MHSFYFVCVLCVGFVSITSFRLPLVTEYSYRESTPVELLNLEHPPSYRQRRSDDCSPDYIGVRFTADNNEVKLSLKRNYDINVNAPLFVNINGTITQETLENLENVAVYQDLENGSSILVQCVPSTRKFELFGTFYNGFEELMIEPELNEGQKEFPAASLDDVQSRDAKSKKEQVSQDQDLRESFTISHHVIYKGKTMRPKESDFILKAGLHPKYRAGTDHSARVKRATTAYQVELLMVADYSAYSFWLTKSSSSAAAKVLLRQFYAFVLNGIDLRYKSLTASGLTITVLFAGLYIAETPSNALWTESRKFLSGSVYQVNASAALGDFESWIQSSYNLPGHDHAMLFTAYDLEVNGNNAVAGLTFLGAACSTSSQSIVEDNFDAELMTIAAHELGHSLGAWHDGTADGTGVSCSPTLAYIMSASVTLSNLGTSGFQYNKNLWKFSPCSISYFRTYVNALNSTNCLTTLSVGYNSTALSPYDQQHPGQVYSADTQCQYTQGKGSYLCRNIYRGNYTNLCTAFYCQISGSRYCSLSIAAERTTCGDRKWCVAGECMMATEAPSVNETCPFGNQPGIVADELTCTQLVANSSTNCYSYTNSCCLSCQNAYTGVTGCEYGDKALGCNKTYCAFYDTITTAQCCETCYVPTASTSSAISSNTTITKAPTTTTSATSPTSTIVNKCTPGTFYSFGSICLPCTAGTYQPHSGQTTCIQCPIGTYQPNINSTECSQCNPGSYQKEIGSSACILCEAGTYQPDPGKSECIVCPGGTYQWQNGSQSCLKCNPGSYQNRSGGSACIPCAEGYYNSITGSESCRRCQIGTFQNSTGQTFCYLCPKDYTTEKEGERSQRACFQEYCPEHRYAIEVSMYTISITIPPTRIGQTGYSWNRCKNDSSRALVSAFCQNVSRTEVIWTEVKMQEECDPEQLGPTSQISAQLLNISKMDVNENNLHNVLQETNKIIQLQENLTYVDFRYLADILGKVNTVDNISKEVLNATLDTVDILIRSSSSTTNIVQKSPGDANRILQIMEDITNKVEVGMSESPVRLIKPSIASSVWEQVGDRLIGIQLLHSNANFIRNDSITYLQREPEGNELLDAAIYFQSDVLNATTNKLGMTVIWNDALFKTGSERYKVVSKIMAAKLLQNGVSITHLGKHYVRGVFLPSDDESRVVCGYWDYTLNQNGGGWTIDGCNHTIDKKKTCLYLQPFDKLCHFGGKNNLERQKTDLEAKSIPPEHEQALEFITFVGLILSIIGISLTILTFLCFRRLRRQRGQQTLFCLCIPMLCYSIIFLVGIKQTVYYVPCIVVSVLIHYFILAAFMWMLMEGVLQYLRFVKVLGTYIPNFLIKTSIPAWGVPLIPVIALLAYDYNLYYGGLGFCWMKLEALYYAFVIPICLIILANAIIFIMVISQICRRPKGIIINQSEWKMTILSLQSALSIFVILGLTWIFGVVALGGAKLVFQYIFVILNAFQGFFIFLLFTAREKQVRDQWARLCCKKPTGHFTSLEQNSSSRGTFSTAVSGRNSGSSMTDNTERQLSSSSQGLRRQSSV